MYYIGVDLGTSSVKLILMEASGNIVNRIRMTGMIKHVKA